MTRLLSRPLGGIVLWLLVVGGVAGATWLVVDTVGREVGRPVLAHASPSVPRATPSPAASVTASATPTTDEPSPSADSVESSAPSTPRPTASQRTPAPAAPTAAPAPPPAVQRTTFTTEGGTLVLSCPAGSLSLDGLTPRDGWSVEHEPDGAGIEVKFTSGEREVKVKATCVDGTPRVTSD